MRGLLLLLPATQALGDEAAACSIPPALNLSSGHSMPAIGLGTWKADAGLVGAAVRAALKLGYRLIDCAAVYGNEQEVGEALAEMVGPGDDQIAREQVFVTTKVWNSEHRKEHLRPAVESSLRDLRLDYLDLVLIHWPQAFEHLPGTHFGLPTHPNGTMRFDWHVPLLETYQALEACVGIGLTRSIGVSNFASSQLAEVLAHAVVPPAVLQIESHPFFANGRLIEFARARGLAVTAYSPLGSGGVNHDGYSVVGHPALAEIGVALGNRSAAQVAVAWQLNRGLAVIPKSTSAARIASNLDVFFDLPPEALAQLEALDEKRRFIWAGPLVERGGAMRPRDEDHPLFPFKMDDPEAF